MASHLAYIKTRTLLGDEQPEELEELISTLERLRATDVYVQIKAITDSLGEMYTRGAGYISKPPEYLAPDNTYKYSHEAIELVGAMSSILEREAVAESAITAAKSAYPHAELYSIDEKIAEIFSRVRASGSVAVSLMFAECASRSETVAAFVAVLELCSSGRVTISDDCETLMMVYADRAESSEDESPSGESLQAHSGYQDDELFANKGEYYG
jgi:segregation and condensation protein A